MTRHKPESTSVSIREIARWWPLAVVVALIAVGGAIWSESRQVPSYSATARTVLSPLPQYDETFFGTDLLRESGDASRTTATVAAIFSSSRAASLAADYLGNGWTPDSVASSVKVSSLEGANIIVVTAQRNSPDQAAKLAEGYVKATLADRWRTIAAGLDARIAALNDSIAAAPDRPNVGDSYTQLEALKSVRAGASDPTMKFDSVSAPVQIKRLSTGTTVSVAAAGGACVGFFAAVGAAMLRRRTSRQVDAIPDRRPAQANVPDDGF